MKIDIWFWADIPLKDCPRTRTWRKLCTAFYAQAHNKN